ncbi:alpha/beta hydrolase [Fibrella aquatica]|uniref:alpha/beta hydrolase n=1 Tax=Fibrella aquatica TaxID=3242487 RepID=UPI0035204DED
MKTHTLHLELLTPAHDERPVFMTGNFCNWAVDIQTLQLQSTGDGRFELNLSIEDNWSDPIEYKYYRGGTDSLELDELGGITANRVLDRDAEQSQDYVPYWQWNGQPINPAFLPVEQTIYADYPGSPTPRRVQVVLPYDYDSSDESYPVLYLNDGQNLIGEGKGYGSWLTEFRLAQLATRRQHRLIIVAIDHAEQNRIKEYTVEAVKPGLGQGRTYLNFLVNTVKPMIDARFRTRSDVANTGIGGSSLGGLISVWGGLLYPDVFGRWLVFSPSLWISPGVYRAAAEKMLGEHTRVYLYGGESESKFMSPNLKRFQDNLRCAVANCAFVQTAIDPDGLHEESWWSAELPRAIQWLFFREEETMNETPEQHEEMGLVV